MLLKSVYVMLDSGRWTDLSLLGLDLGLGSGGSVLGDSRSLDDWSGSGDLTDYQLDPFERKGGSLRLLGSNDLGLGFHSRNSRSLSIGSDRGRNSSIGSKGCAGHLGSRGRFGGSGSLDGGG